MVILGGATSQGLGGGRGTEVPGACWAARPERGWGDSCSLQVREGLGDRDCGLACGGVPGSPTAPSPEGQALQESLLIEESCSSGACSSPAPHRQGDQGNILRLRGGEGSAGQHLWAPRRQGLSLSPPRPSPAPRGPHAAQPLGTALPFPASPSR